VVLSPQLVIDPSPVTLRLMKAPERDTLSPRERASMFGVPPSPLGEGDQLLSPDF
jgi:hypothetical protein